MYLCYSIITRGTGHKEKYNKCIETQCTKKKNNIYYIIFQEWQISWIYLKYFISMSIIPQEKFEWFLLEQGLTILPIVWLVTLNYCM